MCKSAVMADTDNLISTAEAAVILDRPVATVNRWASEGKLPVALKMPGDTGARLYRRADVEALAGHPFPSEQSA